MESKHWGHYERDNDRRGNMTRHLLKISEKRSSEEDLLLVSSCGPSVLTERKAPLSEDVVAGLAHWSVVMAHWPWIRWRIGILPWKVHRLCGDHEAAY